MNRMLIICAMVALVIAGCGKHQDSNRAAIEGNVTLDGQPVEEGSIQFLPMQGVEGSLAGAAIKDGRYELTSKNGPAIGMNRVEIHAMRKTGKMVEKPFPQRGMTEEKVEAVAPQFNTQSTLTFEIKPGKNLANFDVASK